MSSLYGAPTVAGEWRGTYRYAEPFTSAVPVPFTMRLAAEGEGSPAALSGTIRDFGPLGVASVSRGVQSGFAVVFVKVYEAPPPEFADATTPVQYEGILSDDGRVLRGTWRLAAPPAPAAPPPPARRRVYPPLAAPPAPSAPPARSGGLFSRRRSAAPRTPEATTGTWEARRVDPDPLSAPS